MRLARNAIQSAARIRGVVQTYATPSFRSRNGERRSASLAASPARCGFAGATMHSVSSGSR